MTRTKNKGDRYAKTSVFKKTATMNAARVAHIDHPEDEEWIPLSLFYHMGESAFKSAKIDDEVRIEVREWKLLELGWI